MMMATFLSRLAYGGDTNIPLSSTTPANGAAAVNSTAIDNSSGQYLDALLGVQVTTNAAGTSTTGHVDVYILFSTDGINYEDAANAAFAGQIFCSANATTYTGTFNVASVCGGDMPRSWGIRLVNNSGAALAGLVAHYNGAYAWNSAASLLVNPFRSDSVWNTAIPNGMTYNTIPNLGTYSGEITGWWSDPYEGDVKVYYATPSDPLRQVFFNPDAWTDYVDNGGTYQRSGNGTTKDNAMLAKSSSTSLYPMNPYSTQDGAKYWNTGGAPNSYNTIDTSNSVFIRIPDAATPGVDSDGQTVIFQPDGRAYEMYNPYKMGNGTWCCLVGGYTDPVNGLGIGYENGRRASMIPTYAGMLRDVDFDKGVIQHRLALIAPPSMLTTSYVSPALAFDSNPNYTGTIPMGSLLAIDKATNIGTLGLTTSFGTIMATAAQNYGLHIVDRGGSGLSIATQNGCRTTVLNTYSWDIYSDLQLIIQALKRVS